MERSRTRESGRDRDREDTGRRSSRDDDRGGRDSGRDRDSRDRGGRDSGRGGRRNFTYQARSAEDVKKRAAESSKDFDTYLREDVKTYKPADGTNLIRILPPTWEDPKHFAIDIWVHYGVGPDDQAYLCLHKMKGEDCPICEELQRARRDREGEEYVKSLEPTRRSLFYLVDRDNEKEGVQAWAAPFSRIDQAIVKVSVDRRTNEVLPIDDPDDGYDVSFDRGGKGIGTQYSGVAIDRRPSPLGKDEWLNFAIDNPLPTILEYHDYDHIAKVFGGGDNRSQRDSRSSRDDRGSSSRDSGRDRDSGGSTRGGREEASSSGRRGREKVEHTWESVHELEGEDLDRIVVSEDLDLKPDDFNSDEELADAICEELKIEKPSGRRRVEESLGGSSKLAEMRRRRD